MNERMMRTVAALKESVEHEKKKANRRRPKSKPKKKAPTKKKPTPKKRGKR